MNAMNPTPKLSVIVVSFNAPTLLKHCLTSLNQQISQDEVEVIVIRDWDTHSNELEPLQNQFSNVVWISASQGATVPRMRCISMQQSQGEIIALLEDDCVVSPTWCTSVIKAHQSPYIAIGGAVEPGTYKKGLDWGVYFCEYVRFMQPFQGEVQALPGNNVSYKRTALKPFLQDKSATASFYEVFVHRCLQQSGHILRAEPNLVVHNINSWTLSHLLNVPFHHGRGFAGMRFIDQVHWKRWLFAGIAPLLPWLQLSRIAQQVFTRRRYRLRLIRTLPEIFIFSTSWAIGELIGYVFGPGKSLEQWR
jgi:GT2 family glycosyltransferase